MSGQAILSLKEALRQSRDDLTDCIGHIEHTEEALHNAKTAKGQLLRDIADLEAAIRKLGGDPT